MASGVRSKCIERITFLTTFVRIQGSGTVKPAGNFNAEKDSEVLRKAMKGLGKLSRSRVGRKKRCALLQARTRRPSLMC